MKKIILALGLTCSLYAFSQDSGVILNVNDPGQGEVIFLGEKKADYSHVKANGTPYYVEEFKPGKVLVRGTKSQKTLLLRYDAYRDNIEVQTGENSSYTLLKRLYISAVIDNYMYEIQSYLVGKTVRRGYLIALNSSEDNSKRKFYFKPKKILRAGKPPVSGYDDYVPPAYITAGDYYVKNEGEKNLELVKISKKSVPGLFSDQKDAIKKYIKENKLNFKKKEDLAKVLEYYGSL